MPRLAKIQPRPLANPTLPPRPSRALCKGKFLKEKPYSAVYITHLLQCYLLPLKTFPLGFAEFVCRGKGQNYGVFKKPKGDSEIPAGNETFLRGESFPPKESQNPRQIAKNPSGQSLSPRRVILPLEGHFPPSAQLSPNSNALGLTQSLDFYTLCTILLPLTRTYAPDLAQSSIICDFGK